MQFEKINGVTLHYQVIGAPEGKPILVFSNSLGTDFRIWRDVIVRLVGDYGIVTYDKRGHGLSDAPDGPYTMDDHVNDLAGLLDFLDVKNAFVCGLSVGGLIAQGLALSRPGLVRGLVLCDTGHKIGTEAIWNERIERVEAQGLGAIADNIMERWFSKEYRKPDNAALAGYRNMLLRTPVEGYLGTSHAIRDTDFTADTPSIDVPTLCLVGDEDGSTPPALVKELAGLIGGEYEVIEGAGHLPCIEKPEMFFNLLKPFLLKAAAQTS